MQNRGLCLFKFGRPSQRRAHVAPVAQPRHKFGFGSSRKQQNGAAPVATNTVPSNSLALKLKSMISPYPQIATSNKRSKRSSVGGLVSKLAPAAATAAGVSAVSKRQPRSFGFKKRRPAQAPINTKRGIFSRPQKPRKY
ncbi:hypothetical protein [Parasitella parasitica]|uniref:Uncharacterized protein n=1 Tax=Parasitella parasitica TaxID=35722 RepID=A0A0B7NBU9_9FUNG|nr:hypothetical protein [Parasitella parasitica]